MIWVGRGGGSPQIVAEGGGGRLGRAGGEVGRSGWILIVSFRERLQKSLWGVLDKLDFLTNQRWGVRKREQLWRTSGWQAWATEGLRCRELRRGLYMGSGLGVGKGR